MTSLQQLLYLVLTFVSVEIPFTDHVVAKGNVMLIAQLSCGLIASQSDPELLSVFVFVYS